MAKDQTKSQYANAPTSQSRSPSLYASFVGYSQGAGQA